MDVYYKNELLNKKYNPIIVKNMYGLQFSNGSKIIINHTSITSKCYRGSITSNGSDRSIYKTIDLPDSFSTPPSGTIIDGLIIPTMVVYDTSSSTNGSGGYLTDKILKTSCSYSNYSALGSPGINIEIKFSSIPIDAAEITAFFTYLFILPN